MDWEARQPESVVVVLVLCHGEVTGFERQSNDHWILIVTRMDCVASYLLYYAENPRILTQGAERISGPCGLCTGWVGAQA